MRAPLTFVVEKNRKVTAVYPANDSQSCTCKLNFGNIKICFGRLRSYNIWNQY
jgi:hypothetical protein